MNIQIEKKSKQLQEIRIDICKADYAEKVEAALKKQRRTAQVPGFRPGNAPMGMIKRMYEKSFIADEVNNMLYEELYKYLREKKIDILGEPLPVDEKTSVDFENPNDFVFTFEIALEPQFTVDYTSFPSFTQYKIVASDEEIDNAIMDLRKRHGEYSSPDVISADDFVTVEYGENMNGNFYTNDLSDKAKKIFIGKQLKEVVTVDVNTMFDNETKLAAFLKTEPTILDKNEDRKWALTVKYIGHLTPAEINEDLFKKAYPDGSVKNEKDLRKAVSAKIEKDWETHSKRKFSNDAIGMLLDHVKVDFPVDFMKKFILLSQKDLTAEQLEEKYPEYEKSFKWQLIENKLTKENEIKVTEEDVKKYIRQYFVESYFASFNQEDIAERLDALVNDTMKNKEAVKNIYDNLFDERITDVLMKNMQTTVKKVTFKEFADELYGTKAEEKTTKKPRAKKTAAKTAKSEEMPVKQEEEKEAKPKKKAPAKKTATKKAE